MRSPRKHPRPTPYSHDPTRRRAALRAAVEALEARLCPSGYLLVDSYDTNSILRYDEGTGAFLDTLVPKGSGGLDNPAGMVLGRDLNLYVSNHLQPIINGNGQASSVLSFNGSTGALIGTLADGTQVSSPRGIVFGPDGGLYVAEGEGPGTVLRIGVGTGAVSTFVPTLSGGLSHPTGMVFGPDTARDGKLDVYVGNAFTSSILEFQGPDGPHPGAFVGTFVASGAGGLQNPWSFVFGPDGNLYVSNFQYSSKNQVPPGDVLCFQGPAGPHPGAPLGEFVTTGSGGLGTPLGLLFGPDVNGDGRQDLYVSTAVVDQYNFTHAHPGTSEVLVYDGVTGAFLKTLVDPDSGGLSNPFSMAFTETDPTTLNYDGAPGPSAATSGTPSIGAAPIIATAGPATPTAGLVASPADLALMHSGLTGSLSDLALAGLLGTGSWPRKRIELP